MSIKRTFIKNTSVNLFSYFYLAIAAIISIPILVRGLGVSKFGLYTLITSITPMLSVLDFGLSLAVIRYLALPNVSREKKIGVWQTSFYLFALISVALFFLVIIVFHFYIFRLPSAIDIFGSSRFQIMLVIALTMMFNHLNSHLLTLPQANHRFDIFSLNAFINGTASTLVTALIASITPNLLYIMIAQLVGVCLTTIALFVYASTQFGQANFPRFSSSSFHEVIGFGLKSFVGKILSSIEANGLNLVIASFGSIQAVTFFSIPQSLVIKAAGGISMLTLSLLPLSTSLLTPESFPKLKRLVMYLQILITSSSLFGVTLIFMFGRSLLMFWLDDPLLVDNVFPLLQVLSIQLFFTSMTPMPTAILESMNFPSVTSFFAFLTVIIDIALLIFFLPRLGVIGAAWALSISSAITVPLFILVFRRCFLQFEKKLIRSST